MSKLQSLAIRDQNDSAPSFAALAGVVIELADSHDLLLIGPLQKVDGGWWRVVAFSSATTVMTASALSLGRHVPSLVDQATLLAALRQRFAEVKVFTDRKAHALAAQSAWPCPRADAFLAAVELGRPGIHAFTD